MSFASFTTPTTASRRKHLQMITVIYRTEGKGKAMRYWLRECPRISKKSFEEACW